MITVSTSIIAENERLKAENARLRSALVVGESTLAAFYRILHHLGHSKMSDGPNNWILSIMRGALANVYSENSCG